MFLPILSRDILGRRKTIIIKLGNEVFFMKNQTKKVVSFIASACLLATSLTAFGASADEEDVVVTEAPVVTTQAKSTEAKVEKSTEAKSTTKATESKSEKSTEAKSTTKATEEKSEKSTEAKSTEAESKSTTKAETKESKDSDDAVAVTSKALAVAKADEDSSDDTVVTTGADGATTTNAEGTVVTTTIANTDGEDSSETTTVADGTKVTTTKVTTGSVGENPNYTDDAKTADYDDDDDDNKVAYTTTINGAKVTTTYSTTEAVEETVEYTHTNDVVLTIDTSASMFGEPEDLVRQTAIDLVNKILDEDPDAQISLVELQGNSGHANFAGSNYTNDRDLLIDYINAYIDDTIDRVDYEEDFGTDYLEALQQVKLVLDDGTGETKSVVIMTDGVPGRDYDNGDLVLFDVPYGDEEVAADKRAEAVEYANEVIKPLATIYTVGYFQNLENGEEAGEARAFLQDLASDGVEGAKYYEANDKNIDEITDLITQDIIYHAPPEGKTSEDNLANSDSTSTDKDADSPKTGDAGVASVIVLGALACAVVVATKKKND
jgi:hypothetical protein